MVTFGVASDVVSLGRHGEDGEEQFAEVFYVGMTTRSGRRFNHSFRLLNKELRKFEEPEEQYTYEAWVRLDEDEIKGRLQRLCDRIEAHVAAGGKLNQTYWDETYAMYGSEAYECQEAEGLHLIWERLHDDGHTKEANDLYETGVTRLVSALLPPDLLAA
jgi:hypothetical protein